MRLQKSAWHRTCTLLLLLALPIPAYAGEKEDRKEREKQEKAFLEAYQAAPDAKARAKAVDGLKTAPDGAKVSLLLDRVLPREDAPVVVTAAGAVLRTVKEEPALKAMAAAATGKGSWAVREPVLEALGWSDSPLALDALLKVAKDEDAKPAATAIFALAERHPPAALEAVKKQAAHAAWQVRLAALDYLTRLKDRSTVAFLAERLDEESGRLRGEVVETLKAITGKDYKEDVAKWRAFAQGGEAAAAAAGTPPGGAPAPKDGGTGARVAVATGEPPIEPTYYGQKVWSDKVVFVIDLSLSMNLEMVVDREMIVRETGAVVSGGQDGGPAKPGGKKPDEGEIMPIEWWKIRTRIDFAKAQLKYVISTLKRGQMFDIVWFSNTAEAWQGRLTPANPGIKVKACAWVDELKLDDATNSWGGLSKALNLVGRGTEDENYSRGADTIYFLSDGEPFLKHPGPGDIIDKDQILQALERIFQVRRVTIHVVQIGTSPLPFMKRIAEITGGSYKFFNAKGPKAE